MLPYGFYKIVHLIGITSAWTALGALALHHANGGTKATNAGRRSVILLHGLGLLFILVGGFGMLARLGFQHGANFPGWLWVKLGVWVLIGAAVALPVRVPQLAKPMLFVIPLLAGLATYMAVYKPF